jgi:NAD(P)-dependent dehydrogenase (short-subunit alcohol dehydrogenase family)
VTAGHFDGRVAVVTGASRGLGAAYARLLAAEGARVVVNGRPPHLSPTPASQVVAAIEAAGGEAVADFHDVTADGAAVVATALDRWGTVDIVINNAGGTGGGTVEEMRPEDLDRLIDVNFRSSVAVLRAAWPVMRKAGYGRIVNTSSGSVLGLPWSFGYQATKAAIIGLTRALALDGAVHNIKVNAVSPIASTRMTSDIPDERFRDFLAERFPPERCAPFVAALVSESVPCSGELFSVGGGIAARVFLGVTPGWVAPGPATIDDYLSHFADVYAHEGFFVPGDAMAEVAYRSRQLGADLSHPTLGVPDS